MVANAVVGSAIEVFESVKSSLIVPMGGALVVRGEKAAHNTLIYFCSSFLIRIVGWRWSVRDRVDWQTRTIWSHVWDWFHAVYGKTVSSKFGKCRLR